MAGSSYTAINSVSTIKTHKKSSERIPMTNKEVLEVVFSDKTLAPDVLWERIWILLQKENEGDKVRYILNGVPIVAHRLASVLGSLKHFFVTGGRFEIDFGFINQFHIRVLTIAS